MPSIWRRHKRYKTKQKHAISEWDLKHLDDGATGFEQLPPPKDVNGNDGLEDGDADNKMKIENRNENMNWM